MSIASVCLMESGKNLLMFRYVFWFVLGVGAWFVTRWQHGKRKDFMFLSFWKTSESLLFPSGEKDRLVQGSPGDSVALKITGKSSQLLKKAQNLSAMKRPTSDNKKQEHEISKQK